MAKEKRLIDANKLIVDLKTFKGLGAIMAETLVRFVKKQPTVDAVEVVRCMECRFWKNPEFGLGDCTHSRFRRPGYADVTTRADGYCYFGERRDKNGQ